MPKWFLFLAVILMWTAAPRAAAAEIGFELYSWKQGSEWNFAVFEGTAAVRSAQALRSRSHRLKNLNFLKGRIATLPAGEKLSWRVDEKRGLRLPPKEIVRQVDEFATLSNVTLLLPGQNTDGKTLERLQTEVQQIVE